MKTLCFFLGFLAFAHLQGQKLVKKALVNAQTHYIQIDSQFCYKVNLDTSATDEVTIEASMEGEYSKDLIIAIEEQGATLLISARFQPNFTNPNDKLSAHKVISIALDVKLPEYKDVYIYGTSSNVSANGKYKKLKVKLSDGRCQLNNVRETVEVTTQKGDITLTVPAGNIVARSTYGKVFKEDIPFGDNQFTLNTIEGKIHLKKTK
ncbi:DUF4097 family beta strand repeat-containing protein [Flagellimonas sp. S3867]|uniref:DUF4097 family beta strand repeat-containing protein n=1 Tax=Flagellimonas sp. S3867 TaxID=2768063 RepID=UPI001685AADD|nr:DUF4097 family beta strand repeat-containing protein [Flagellimonas sp. S3867]